MARKAESKVALAGRRKSAGRRARFVPDIVLAMAAWPLLCAMDRLLDRVESNKAAKRLNG